MMNSAPFDLPGLLEETLEKTTDLLHLLEQETEALKIRQIDAIQGIAQKKLALVERLNQLVQNRLQLLQGQGWPPTQEGLEGYLTGLGEKNGASFRLREIWNQICHLWKQCQLLNETNGALITLLQRNARRSLDILRGQAAQSHYYGPDGSAQRERDSRSLATI